MHTDTYIQLCVYLFVCVHTPPGCLGHLTSAKSAYKSSNLLPKSRTQTPKANALAPREPTQKPNIKQKGRDWVKEWAHFECCVMSWNGFVRGLPGFVCVQVPVPVSSQQLKMNQIRMLRQAQNNFRLKVYFPRKG